MPRVDEPKLSGWGRTFAPGREVTSEDLERLSRDASLSRGLGRSYGDASLPAPNRAWVAGSFRADRILSFDPETAVLRAEAGLSLAELNRLYVSRGFFTPVTPGTKFVTLGGMIASDVHGKNHHVAGTIGRHVRSLRMRLADGRIVECSRTQEPELFFATLGGMGLTGHVLEVELTLSRIPSPWIYQETKRIADLQSFMVALKEAGKTWPFTVGWVDTVATGSTLGRGVLFSGRWAEPSEAPKREPKRPLSIPMPFMLPPGVLNRLTMTAFNTAVYYTQPKHRFDYVDYDKFFYPLDRVLRWNLIYGPRGVTQHQCVLPDHRAFEGLTAMVNTLRDLNAVSFLTVMKDCGAQGEGLLSFPMAGMSLALDIPINDRTQEVIDRLNETVIAHEGRIYLTKDGFTKPEHFRAMDARVQAFLQARKRFDPEGRIHSAQSHRLFGE